MATSIDVYRDSAATEKLFSLQATNYSITEDSTPLDGGDSTGSVGTFTITAISPDKDLTPNHPIIKWGPQFLSRKTIQVRDSTRGYTTGYVTSVSADDSAATVTLTCNSRLGHLNAYNINAKPFVGTLKNAVLYYCSLAGQTTDILVDDSIASKTVVFPGWSGELWYHLKLLMAGMGVDLSLVSGVIYVRPIRVREAIQYRDTARSISSSSDSTAKSIEIYCYNTKQITDSLVYPPGGWSSDVEVITCNAGETIEQQLELSASVSEIKQPAFSTSVKPGYNASSVFTVVGDDGLPISSDAFYNNGGAINVAINDDTTSLTLTFTAPTGLASSSGTEISVYAIALSSDTSTRYSTLRIVGSGVSYDKQKVTIPTGLTAQEASTEVGVTIDNPFIRDLDTAYTVGCRAASSYSGRGLSATGTVTQFNKSGDSGVISVPSYDDAQTIYAGKTYAEVQTTLASYTYASFRAYLASSLADAFENQIFGNVNGARVWDHKRHRWFRVRSGTITPSVISFNADDDIIFSDVQSAWGEKTYTEVYSMFSGLTYSEVQGAGLYGAE